MIFSAFSSGYGNHSQHEILFTLYPGSIESQNCDQIQRDLHKIILSIWYIFVPSCFLRS